MALELAFRSELAELLGDGDEVAMSPAVIDLKGRRYLLTIFEENDKSSVCLGLDETPLRKAVPPLIGEWAAKLGVRVEVYFVPRMKTKGEATTSAKATSA